MDEAARRAEFRAFVREHHPDRGGDPEVFKAGMARFAAEWTEPADPAERESRFDAPVAFSTQHPLPLRVAIALIRTVRWHRNNRVV